MDLMRARVALRERPLLDVLDLTLRFCTQHAWAYAKMSVVVLVPAFAASWAAARLGGWWLGWAATIFFTCFAGVPFVALASRLVFADAVSTREALGIALRSLPGVIAVRILQLVALSASALVLGLAWFWLGTILLFVVEVLVLEQGGVGATLGRAQRLANAHFGDAVLAMLLLAGGPVCAAMLADVAGREILQGILEVKPPASMFRVGGSWVALVGWWSVLPLLQTARFFVYLDIRTRTEGWDIQTRFAGIAARAEAERQEKALGAPPMRRGIAGALAILAILSVASPAHAVLDPGRAQSDVDAAIHDGDYTFCREPRTPLSGQARDLCANATAIPDCAGFAAECAKTAAPPPSSSSTPWWRWFPHLASLPGVVATIAQVVLWALVGALVLAILIPVVRAIARMRREDRPDEKKEGRAPLPAEQPFVFALPTTTDEEALLARANELARAGQFAAALQHYLAASLRALDKRGAVRIARDRTNGEYVRACADPNAKPVLRDIVREVDRVQFGGEAATMEAATRAAQRAMAIVRAVPVMLLAVLLAGALGCGGAAKSIPRAGDDPAGGEVFLDVLRRQGVTVLPLRTSLASLPMPKAGEREAAVVVDLTKTDLDDDTRDHLAAWVKEGGVLVLAGNPFEWPKQFGATMASAKAPYDVTAKRLLARSAPSDDEEEGEEAEDDDDDAGTSSAAPGSGGSSGVYARTTEKGQLVEGYALGFKKAVERVATFPDGMTYAAVLAHGKGFVLGIASDELMRNAGIARPGNAAAMVAIFSSADRLEMRMADAEDGMSPPGTPVAALLRAGLGTGLVHALVATLVLFFAVGIRLARPKPSAPPRRRAFAEHVEAVGALYARTRNAPHALAAYARFADDRLRARMPRGTSDVAAFVASRARIPVEVAQRLWTRAVQAKAGAPPLGDEMTVLHELSAVVSAAMAQDRA
jgi:hypothetical protein